MKYENFSIKKAMNMIVQKQMYLPEFQRSFVWHEEQIENLFDSIIMGYPIGTLLFWKTTKKAITENNLVLYEFIKDYHQRDCADNKKAPEKLVTDYDNYYLVLDGQQRLSALYIALQGSIAYKIKKKWWNTDEAFPKKKLYFNLDSVSEQKQDEDGNVKRFKFYSDKEVPTSENFWFKVCNIIDFDTESDVFQYIYTYGLNEIQGKNIMKLFKIFNASGDEAILNFYSIEESNYDDVLNIFVRVNASGTYLSKTDLLFSTIVSGWRDGREKIESLIKELNNKGGKFNFNKDFIMRTCLVLTGAAVNLKIDSFKKETVANIREEFDNIKTALIKTVKMLVDLGFCQDNISSYNALIPVAYYMYKGGTDSEETLCGLRKYLVVSFLKNIYGVASNAALTAARSALDKIKCSTTPFDIEIFKDIVLVGNRKFSMSMDEIDDYFYEKKGWHTFLLLTVLYPNMKLGQIEWHQDHVHPYTAFETSKLKSVGITDRETVNTWHYEANTLPNLQLLEGRENESKNKMTLSEWCEKGNTVAYLDNTISKDIKDFDAFYEHRKQKMLDELTRILNI